MIQQVNIDDSDSAKINPQPLGPEPIEFAEDPDIISEDDDDDEEEEEEEEDDDEELSSPQISHTIANGKPLATDHDTWFAQFPALDPEYKILDKVSFTWSIADFNHITESKITSPRFTCHNIEFEILIFPRGNDSNYLAVYLAPVQLKQPCCVQFGFLIWNKSQPEVNFFNKSQHRFSSEEPDWGFSTFTMLTNLAPKVQPSDVCPAGIGFVDANGTLNITCFINVVYDATGILWSNLANYNSRQQTGYTGINNQGATCYLNSLIQSYYFTRVFRKSVFQIPTESSKDFAMALQRLFYHLYSNDDPASTNELTRAFGWDAADSFTQHDVQELNRILMDRLEAKMKGTVVEDMLTRIFVGKMKSFIKCVNVDYESFRVEDFWDIQLNVKNLKNLEESFQSYVAKEILDGENKYDAEKYGLQVAEKGVVFEQFPNVLHLQLKRFDYDFMYDQMVKVNERHEYPEFIDLKPYLDPENKEAMAEDWNYELFAVLIHSGDISSGHYYAMIKPSPEKGWFRFDDDKVVRVTRSEVFEDNFGKARASNEAIQKMSRSQYADYQIRRHTSAYMLVYFRKSKIDEVLCDFDEEKDIPQHISSGIKREREEAEARRKEQEEQHLYLKVNLYGVQDRFQKYQGFDLGVNRLYNHRWNSTIYDVPGELKELDSNGFENQSASKLDNGASTPPFVVKKLRQSTIKELFEFVASGYPPQDSKYLRLWIMAHRRNETSRPDVPISIDYETKYEKNINLNLSSLPYDTKLETILEKFVSKRPSGLFIWVEDTRQDISQLFKTFGSPPQFAEIPKNFMGIPKLLSEYSKLAVQSKSSEFEHAVASGNSSTILILLKYFDVVNQTMTGVAHSVVSKDQKIGTLTPIIAGFMGLPTNTPLTIYEEVKPNSIDKVDENKSFASSELQNGDILVFSFEKSPELVKQHVFPKLDAVANISNVFKCDCDPSEKEASVAKYVVPFGLATKQDILENRDKLVNNVLVKCSTVVEFYTYLRTRVHIVAGPGKAAEADDMFVTSDAPQKYLDFWVGLQTDYKDIAKAIGNSLNLDPYKIRLFAKANANSQRIPLSSSDSISRLIGSRFNNNMTIFFQFEVLSIKMEELESMKLVKIGYLPSGVLHVQPHEVLINKESSVSDLVDKLLAKLAKTGDAIDKRHLEIWRVQNHRITKVFTLEDSVKDIQHKSTIYIRPLAKDELESLGDYLYNNPSALLLNSGDSSSGDGKSKSLDKCIIQTVQFSKEPSNGHGIPFHFILKKGEQFDKVKQRMQHKLALGDKEFNKIKIGLLDLATNKKRYCTSDSTILFDEVSVSDVLFLDHPDRSVHRYNHGGAIKIN